MSGDKGKRYTFWLSQGLMERVRKLASQADMTEGRMVSNMLEVMTDALEASRKVGVFQLSLLLRDMREDLKESTRTRNMSSALDQ